MPITQEMFEATKRRQEAAKTGPFTIMSPPPGYKPTEKYLKMQQESMLIAKGQVTAADYPNMETQFDPGAEWDYRTATTGRDGEPLPAGAIAWEPSGRPYYGESFEGTWNHLKGIFARAVTMQERYPVEEDMDFGEQLGVVKDASWETLKLGGELAWTVVEPILDLADQVLERPTATASMTMEDLAADSNWEAMPEIVKGDWFNVVERLNPIRWVYNMARVIEASTHAEPLGFDGTMQVWKDNWAASRMGWSVGAGDAQLKEAFKERVNAGCLKDLLRLLTG